MILESPAPGITRITFDRPETRNAIDRATVDAVRAAMDETIRSGESRVLIFAGSEKVFVSGADIRELRDRDKSDALAFINTGLFHDIEDFPLPTIAAIRGWALGGGCELAAACDLRVAGRGARFGQPEVKLGIIPGAGATYRLPRLIGLGNAKDLILTGRTIDAEEALRMGLVNRVVDDESVLDTATALANEIAENGSLAVRFARMALNVSAESSGRAGRYLEATAQAVTFEDEDKRNRMTEFLEGRSRK